MMLTENAFAVLGAMPSDNRRAIHKKADEAALLGGFDTESALNQLIQMNRRITAELSWPPASSAEASDSFLSYARAVSEGQPARIPSLEGIGSALAQANALAALFEIWPAERPELFSGLCRAPDRILSQVTAGDALQAINAHRTAGGWETVQDTLTLNDPLNERLRELYAPAARAMAKLDQETAASTLKSLYGSTGVDVQGVVAEIIGDAYAMRVHEDADNHKDWILGRLNDPGRANRIMPGDLDHLRLSTDRWCALTAPLRLKAGQARNDAKTISMGIRNAIVEYVNKHGTEKKPNPSPFAGSTAQKPSPSSTIPRGTPSTRHSIGADGWRAPSLSNLSLWSAWRQTNRR